MCFYCSFSVDQLVCELWGRPNVRPAFSAETNTALTFVRRREAELISTIRDAHLTWRSWFYGMAFLWGEQNKLQLMSLSVWCCAAFMSSGNNSSDVLSLQSPDFKVFPPVEARFVPWVMTAVHFNSSQWFLSAFSLLQLGSDSFQTNTKRMKCNDSEDEDCSVWVV